MLQIPDNLLASNVGWEPLIQTVVALLFCLVGRLVSQRLVVARAKERRARYLWTKWLRAAWVFLASLLVTFIWFVKCGHRGSDARFGVQLSWVGLYPWAGAIPSW